MGRKRKPEHLKKTTIFLRMPNPLFWKIEEIAEAQDIKINDLIVKILENTVNKEENEKK